MKWTVWTIVLVACRIHGHARRHRTTVGRLNQRSAHEVSLLIVAGRTVRVREARLLIGDKTWLVLVVVTLQVERGQVIGRVLHGCTIVVRVRLACGRRRWTVRVVWDVVIEGGIGLHTAASARLRWRNDERRPGNRSCEYETESGEIHPGRDGVGRLPGWTNVVCGGGG